MVRPEPPGAETPPNPEGLAPEFLQRAWDEAQRYGPDAWIFVRELLQNARDAGATRVDFRVEQRGSKVVLRCRDDGEGMAFAHARRYLFALYASSKQRRGEDVGRFGVGFWSILRFHPTEITIQSRTRTDPGWSITFDGALESARFGPPPTATGTEIVLVRDDDGTPVASRVRFAAVENGRFLQSKSDERTSVSITVDDRMVNETFALPAPSVEFVRGKTRGVIGLGQTPLVELFSRGIRVRAAACLDDLLSPSNRSDNLERLSGAVGGGLVPRMLLESADIEPVLSRTDARDDRALRRVVRLAHRELERLVERQFAHARPVPWWRRGLERIGDRLRQSLFWQSAVAAGAGGALAAMLAFGLWGDRLTADSPAEPASPSSNLTTSIPSPRPYADLSSRYGGPKVDVLREPPAALALRYAPADQELHFSALRFSKVDETGPQSLVHPKGKAKLYAGVAGCNQGCTDVAIVFASASGWLRIPIPTGTRLVEGTASVDGRPIRPWGSAEDLPMVWISEAKQGVLRYRVADAKTAPKSAGNPPPLPHAAEKIAAAARTLPVESRVSHLRRAAARLVRYDRSGPTAAAHERAEAAGSGFLERTLAIGAGDCDVQNGLLAALLQAAGVEARLAIGPIGRDGQALPWLHAWVEYRNEDGRWLAVDASSPQPGPASLDPSSSTIASQRTTGGVRPPPAHRTSAESSTSSDRRSEAFLSSGEVTPPTAIVRKPANHPVPTSSFDRDLALSTPTATEAVAQAPVAVAPVAFFWPSWILFLAGSVPVGFAGSWFVRRRIRRTIDLDERPDLSGLLVGALQQPLAFARLPFIHQRRLVPLVDGSAISLQEARQLATEGRLFSAAHVHGPVVQRALRERAKVLDTSKREGQGVAAALGATDLDRWASLLDTAFMTPFVESLNRTLRGYGVRWTIRLAPDLAGGVANLDLGHPVSSGRGTQSKRITLVDGRDPAFAHYDSIFATAPTPTIFYAIDDLARRIGLPTEQRALLLNRAARDIFAAHGKE